MPGGVGGARSSLTAPYPDGGHSDAAFTEHMPEVYTQALASGPADVPVRRHRWPDRASLGVCLKVSGWRRPPRVTRVTSPCHVGIRRSSNHRKRRIHPEHLRRLVEARVKTREG